MKVNDKYVTKTGECLTVKEIGDELTVFRVFESDYALEGPTANIGQFLEQTGAVTPTDMDWKRRLLAMRFFQDCKHDKDYPHKDYLGQYEEMKEMPDSTIISMFDLGSVKND